MVWLGCSCVGLVHQEKQGASAEERIALYYKLVKCAGCITKRVVVVRPEVELKYKEGIVNQVDEEEGT